MFGAKDRAACFEEKSVLNCQFIKYTKLYAVQ